MEQVQFIRSNSDHKDFHYLITRLDHELWNEMMKDQATYDQYNKVPGLDTVVLAYHANKAIACGCFKKHNEHNVEIKRMFTLPEYRGKAIAAGVLGELEKWAVELGYQYAVLETGKKLTRAQQLYRKSGYTVIDNYDQYIGMEESVCMRKQLTF